jgi:putative ABC transport system permease protein
LSKYQRIKESVLLRTLGANKRQILSINAVEYALIGALAAAAGILLSIIGAYLLATFQLDLEFNIKWLPIVAVFLLVTFMTMFIGMFNSRDVIRKAPLEVLRKEI